GPRRALPALHPGRPLISLDPGWPLGPDRALISLCPARPLISLYPGRTLDPGRTLQALGAARAGVAAEREEGEGGRGEGLAGAEGGERSGARGGADGDLEPATLAIEGTRAKVQIDGDQSAAHRVTDEDQRAADLRAGCRRIEELEAH